MHISISAPTAYLDSDTHQLLFHVCRTCGSWMLCLSACSSRKSNIYLMASGRALPRWAVLKMVSNRSSTNFCSVPYRARRGELQRFSHSLIFQNFTNSSRNAINMYICFCVSLSCAVHDTFSPSTDVYVSDSYLTDPALKSACSFDGGNCYFTADF